MTLGERFITLRKEKGFTQDDVADHLNVSRQTISNWENGSAAPSIQKAKELAALYQISLDAMVGNAPIHKPHNNLMKAWEGKVCKVLMTGDYVSANALQYPARVIEVDDEWITLEFQKKKGQRETEIMNIETIKGLIEVGDER